MYYFIECLRALAVAWITNSHFKGVYFTGWKSVDFLAFGGGIGVALFFMITGFLLGEMKADSFTGGAPFGKWYLKKIIRMYLPFLIFSVLKLLLGFLGVAAAGISKTLEGGGAVTYTGGQMFHQIDTRDWISMAFPLNYWFVYVMAILYAVYYLYVKCFADRYKRTDLFVGAVLAIIFLVWYALLDKSEGEVLLNPNPIMWLIWFDCMLTGRGIRRNYGILQEIPNRGKSMLWLSLAAVSLIVFLIVKVCMAKEIMTVQICLPVSYIGFAYGCFRLFMGMEDRCKKLLTGEGLKGAIGKIVNLVSTASLEVYYVQFIWIGLLKNIVFPVNWILLVVCIVASAYVLHLAAGQMVKITRNEIWRCI